MKDHNQMVNELKHLVRYYSQAAHDFFDDVSAELQEELASFYGCLEQDKNSPEEYQKMVGLLVAAQENLKERVEDLKHLTDQMNVLLQKAKEKS